jgi:hypothetical protein
MKKLTLLLALLVSLVAKAEMDKYGCGWVFRSTVNMFSDGKNETERRYGDVEIYWNHDCTSRVKIVYANGSYEYYYVKSNAKVKDGQTYNGTPYKVFDMYDEKTDKKVSFQILYGQGGVSIKLIYGDGYIEFG